MKHLYPTKENMIKYIESKGWYEYYGIWRKEVTSELSGSSLYDAYYFEVKKMPFEEFDALTDEEKKFIHSLRI